MSDDWRDVRRDTNRAGRLVLLWVSIAIAFALIVSAILWSLGVFTSDIKGEGDAIKQKNAGTNRVAQQARFNQLYQGILADDRKITVMKTEADAHPNDMVIQTNYNGLKNGCQGRIGEYNALARSYTAEEFRDADLPSQIDLNDRSTDCEPNNAPSSTEPTQPEETR